MTEPVFGITFTQDDNEARPVVASDMSTVYLCGTAPGADATFYPVNQRVLISSSDAAALTKLGTTGTLPAAVRTINDQLGEFQVAARIVINRVAEGATVAATIANLIGTEADRTGIYGLLEAGPELGVIPRLVGVPGYTHQEPNGLVSVPITAQGNGYTNATVNFAGVPAGATAPQATAVIGTGADAGKIVGITVTNAGLWLVNGLTATIAGDGNGATLGVPVLEALANPICAALPSVLNRVLAHAAVEGPGTTDIAAKNWREKLSSRRLMPVDAWVKVMEGALVVTRPGAPALLGVLVRRDYEKRGVPSHSPANQAVQGILGPLRRVPFSLTDGATAGQDLLSNNIGVIVAGEMGVESAVASSGFVLIATDTASEDVLWQMINVSRMRDYIHLGLLKTWRFYLGRYNITGQTIQSVLNTAGYWLRDLKADDHILGYRVGFEKDKNSPENLRLGKFRCFFQAEEAPVLKHIDADSRRYRQALDDMLDNVLAQVEELAG